MNALDEKCKDHKKVTLNLQGDAITALEWLMQQKGLTMAEVFRRALGTEYFIEKEQQKGSKILVQDKNNKYSRLIFR